MIYACIITYNDFPLIKACIESIENKADRIIAVDGRYKQFTGDSDYSTDGTLEYLESKKNITLLKAANLSEVEKRNKYLEMLADGDICLNIDADEVLVGELEELKCDFGILDFHDSLSKNIQTRATRFFKYREGMKYCNVHYTLYWQGKIVNKLHKVVSPDFSSQNISDFYILHNWHLRGDTRKHYKSIYYKKLLQIEAGFER